jgi:hypothetical protein
LADCLAGGVAAACVLVAQVGLGGCRSGVTCGRDMLSQLMFLSVTAADDAPAIDLEPEEEPRCLDSKPSDICDSSGRPLFGGLRALKVASSSWSSPQDRERAPSTNDNKMPEQPVSSHLRQLVTKHEQNSR